VVFATSPIAAQEVEESDVQAWFQYQYQHRVSESIRGSWGLGYRDLISTEDELADWSRLHFIGDFVYSHSRRVSFEGGFGGYYTFAGELSDLWELRTWQGAIVFWPAFKLAGRQIDLRHRFRLEQRWTNQRDGGDSEFGLRLRYRLASFIPLTKPTIENGSFYVPLMGETFSDLGDDSLDYFAARLRLTVGVGYVFNDYWTLEFRYTAQQSRDQVLNRFKTDDHILDFRIRTAVLIRDLLSPSGD